MTKRQAINIITNCAKQYHKNLDSFQIAFVYRDVHNHATCTEVRFRSYNFLHFTGILPRVGLNANDFYRYALNNRISEHDFSFKDSHITELKLQILETIMNIDSKARIIGNYIGPHVELFTEKVTGTTTACLGLISHGDCYIPNSVLKEDIRNITPKSSGKIYAIFKKKINHPLYTELTYKSKNFRITKKNLPKNLLDHLKPSLLEDITSENCT